LYPTRLILKRSALVADNNGLADIEMIAEQAIEYLLPSGWLLIEHGYQQAEDVTTVLKKNHFQQCMTIKDLSGQPRVTMGQKL